MNREQVLQKAKQAVYLGKNGFGNIEYAYKCIDEALGLGLSLEEMETTQEEVDNFPRAFTLRKAKEAVDSSRNGYCLVEYLNKCIEEALSVGISLEEIGITQEEVDSFPRVFLLREAKEAIKSARNGYGRIEYVYKHINAALAFGISFEEIGTTRREVLNSFPRVFLLPEVKEAVDKSRNGCGSIEYAITCINLALAAGISFEEMGTTQDEVDGFLLVKY